MDYSKTVNLLQTSFPMKADLPVREPRMLEEWERSGLYERIQKEGKDRPVFLLHDGPPYANGEIHMGHALNKVLKDFVVKYKTLAGFRSPYKPGWDCHGLPIEHALFKQLGKSKHQVSRVELRQKATDYALGFVDKQRAGFKRLGVLGEWGDPYLTLSKEYEAGIVETFFELKDKGFIYKGLKPGYWCAFDETALAEAEVEYAEKKSDSVFVRFELEDDSVIARREATRQSHEIASPPSGARNDKVYILIWTTTPWTLPANRGLAFHPDETYTLIEKDGARYVVAAKLKDAVMKKIGATGAGQQAFRGKDLAGLRAKNPLTGHLSQGVTASYVTMEDGTGVVHIAPGHGVEDFAVGQQWKLETVSPVNERGEFDPSVGRPDLVGKHVLKDANAAVMEALGKDLVFHQAFTHSYPHCWRCKNPIIFRATEQWFLQVSDAFRNQLLKQIDQVRWEPEYGVHRIKGMVEVRPDWCLSRQRHWGAPIAVLYCKGCGEVLWNQNLNAKIVELIRTKGSDAYYETAEEDLLKLAGSPSCARCKGTSFRKEMDILDVWFDSGVSWHSVIERCFANPKPQTVMYLEGSDQHRGWFQTSLIPSVALRGKAPYDIVLTHGFVVDGKGHKMSKSLGNVISPQEIIEKYGADILRLWVAASDYREDVRLSQDIVKHVIDIYRRFRNTLRFLLQNTSDFTWVQHRVPSESLQEVDRWILVHFEEIKARVRDAYEAYQFHVVLSELNRFVSVTLSGFYLDAIKDLLYCERPDSPARRSAQTALFQIGRGLSVLLAPLLSFTAEEAYLELKKVSGAGHAGMPDSVFLDRLDALGGISFDEPLNTKWLKILEVRGLVNDELDRQRKAGVLKSSQEASVRIQGEKPVQEGLDWPFILQMAEVEWAPATGAAPSAEIRKTSFAKCARCWRHRADVGRDGAHAELCGRCAAAVRDLAPA